MVKSRYEVFRSRLVYHGLDKLLERPDFDSALINGPNRHVLVVGRYEVTDRFGESAQVYPVGFDMKMGLVVYNHRCHKGDRGRRTAETSSCEVIHVRDIKYCTRLCTSRMNKKSKMR